MRAKIDDVARIAGVSIMTVSRAIRGIDGVSDRTRVRVLEIAGRLGYQPNNNASSLALSRSHVIGISVPTLNDEVFADMLEGMRSVLEHGGYDLMVEVTGYDLASERSWIERMLKWSPAGLVITGCDHCDGIAALIAESAIPTVEIWDHVTRPIDVCVGIDHWQTGALAAKHLLERGYRNACIVGIAAGRDPRAEKRFAGFSSAFQAGGQVRIERVDTRPSFEAGYNGVLNVMADKGMQPDCCFFLNDHLAFGGLCALERCGLDVPEEVGVVGFNDLGINRVLGKRITTFSTARLRIGQIAARKLLARIHGAVTEVHTMVPVTLIEGQTTRSAGRTLLDGLPRNPS